MRGSRTLWRPLAIWIAPAAVAVLFYIDLCALVFDCGCHSLWRGAAAACNIQHAGPPDCPWCRGAWWSGYAPLLGILVVQALIAGWPGRGRPLLRFLLALGAFPILGSLLGGLYGLATGYWS